jgi:hypothetical protein
MLLLGYPDDEIPGISNSNYEQKNQSRRDSVHRQDGLQQQSDAGKQKQHVACYRQADKPYPVQKRKFVVPPLSGAADNSIALSRFPRAVVQATAEMTTDKRRALIKEAGPSWIFE